MLRLQAKAWTTVRGVGRSHTSRPWPIPARPATRSCRRPDGVGPEAPTRAEVPRTCVPPPGTHMPLMLHARGNPHTNAQPSPTAPRHPPTAPETADRSTAWMWPTARVAMQWRECVALGEPTLEQNVCRWGGLGVHAAEAVPRVACREHSREAGGEAVSHP